MAELKAGMKAPDFELPTGDGTMLSLGGLRGKKVVLYFYPTDDTPTCTKEACSFQENLSAIKKKDAIVVGVSTDGIASHKKFADKYGLSFPLVSDENKELAGKYGVWRKKQLFGKKYMGVVRTTFVIDEKGTITHIFTVTRVNGHTKDVLKALSS